MKFINVDDEDKCKRMLSALLAHLPEHLFMDDRIGDLAAHPVNGMTIGGERAWVVVTLVREGLQRSLRDQIKAILERDNEPVS